MSRHDAESWRDYAYSKQKKLEQFTELVDLLCEEYEKLPELIDCWFLQGKTAAECERGMEACPYVEGETARHWWARGNESVWRLLRAIEAEAKLDRIKAIPEKPPDKDFPGDVWGYNQALADVRKAMED